MALRENMDLVAVYHKKKGKIMINAVDADKFVNDKKFNDKCKDYSLEEPVKETKKIDKFDK